MGKWLDESLSAQLSSRDFLYPGNPLFLNSLRYFSWFIPFPLIFIGVLLLYNVMLISAVQWSESAIRIRKSLFLGGFLPIYVITGLFFFFFFDEAPSPAACRGKTEDITFKVLIVWKYPYSRLRPDWCFVLKSFSLAACLPCNPSLLWRSSKNSNLWGFVCGIFGFHCGNR